MIRQILSLVFLCVAVPVAVIGTKRALEEHSRKCREVSKLIWEFIDEVFK